MNNRCSYCPHLAGEASVTQGGSVPCGAQRPSAGERPWFVWVRSPKASYLAPWVLAPVAPSSALRFVPFSYCFWGFCLNISGTSRVAQNMAIGSVSGSLVAEWLLLSIALVPPRRVQAASNISSSRCWGKLPCRGQGSVH